MGMSEKQEIMGEAGEVLSDLGWPLGSELGERRGNKRKEQRRVILWSKI